MLSETVPINSCCDSNEQGSIEPGQVLTLSEQNDQHNHHNRHHYNQHLSLSLPVTFPISNTMHLSDINNSQQMQKHQSIGSDFHQYHLYHHHHHQPEVNQPHTINELNPQQRFMHQYMLATMSAIGMQPNGSQNSTVFSSLLKQITDFQFNRFKYILINKIF